MIKYSRIIALSLAAVLILSLTACGGGEQEEQQPAAGVAVQVETVRADTIATENKVSGKISADSESTILIATAAKCTAVYAQAGDQVQAGDGQLPFQLQRRPHQLQLRRPELSGSEGHFG